MKIVAHTACLVLVGACSSVAVVDCIIAETDLYQRLDKTFDWTRLMTGQDLFSEAVAAMVRQ